MAKYSDGVAVFGAASRNAFAHNMIPGPSTRYLYIEIPRRRGRRCRLQVCSSCAAARHSNFHWNAHVRPDGQSFVEWRPSDPPSIFTEYALPTDRGLTCGDGQLVDCLRCVAVRLGQKLQVLYLVPDARRLRMIAATHVGANVKAGVVWGVGTAPPQAGLSTRGRVIRGVGWVLGYDHPKTWRTRFCILARRRARPRG